MEGVRAATCSLSLRSRTGGAERGHAASFYDVGGHPWVCVDLPCQSACFLLLDRVAAGVQR